MLSAIKIFSIVIAAASGVMGSVINFKSTSGKITRWGMICVALIILSSLLSGGIQVYEDGQSEQDTLKLMRANSEALTRINRSLLHFNKIGVYALVAPDWSIPKFHKLMLDIRDEQDPFFNSTMKSLNSKHESNAVSLSADFSGFGGGVYGANRSQSSLFLNTLCMASIKILVFKGKMIKDVSLIPVGSDNQLLSDDLSITVGDPCSFDYDYSQAESGKSLSHKPFSFEYGAKDGKYIHLSHPINVEVSSDDQNNWKGNGSVLSIPDLLSSTLIFELSYLGQLGDGTGNGLRRSVGISYLRLSFPDGISLAFSKKNMTSVVLPNGDMGYLVHTGKSLSELLKEADINELSVVYPE